MNLYRNLLVKVSAFLSTAHRYDMNPDINIVVIDKLANELRDEEQKKFAAQQK